MGDSQCQVFGNVDIAIARIRQCLDEEQESSHNDSSAAPSQADFPKQSLSAEERFSKLHASQICGKSINDTSTEFQSLMESVMNTRKLQRSWERRLVKKVTSGLEVTDAEIMNPRINTFRRKSKRPSRKRKRAADTVTTTISDTELPPGQPSPTAPADAVSSTGGGTGNREPEQVENRSTGPQHDGRSPERPRAQSTAKQCGQSQVPRWAIQNNDFMFSDDEI